MNILGLILGIVPLVVGWVPVVGWIITVPCVLAGLPLSAIGLVQNLKRKEGIGIAVAGILLNLLVLAVLLIFIGILLASMDESNWVTR